MTEIITETSGQYTHYFVKSESHWDGKLYIGLSAPYYDNSASGQYRMSAVRAIIDFAKSYYTANESAFLPGEIVVEKEKVNEFIARAAEWYVTEYELYLAGLAV